MKLFLATPISSLSGSEKFATYKKEVLRLTDHLAKSHAVHAEVLGLDSVASYDSPIESLSIDMKAIADSDIFMLHYPEKIVSSTLIELGYAIAFRKYIIVIAPDTKILPYLAKGLSQISSASIIQSSEINDHCLSCVETAIAAYDRSKTQVEWNKVLGN